MADTSTPTFGFKLAYKNPMGDNTPSTNDKPVVSNTTDSTPIFGFKLAYKNPMDDNTPSTNDKSVASNTTDLPSIFNPLDFMQSSSAPSYDYSGMTAMAENEGYAEGNLMGGNTFGYYGCGSCFGPSMALATVPLALSFGLMADSLAYGPRCGNPLGALAGGFMGGAIGGIIGASIFG